MKPGNFRYWDPKTVDETVRFLEQNADDTKLLAGGQSLMPVISMRLARPDYLLDINGITELDYIRVDGDRLRIGALTRHEAIMRSAEVKQHVPLLAQAMPFIGHTAIRYRGTIGGSIVHADPSAELPAVAVGTDAEITVQGPRGKRTIAAGEYFLSFFTTSMELDEMLVEVAIPIRSQEKGTAVTELARRHGDFAVAGAMVSFDANGGGKIDSARITAFGVDDVPRRVDEAESLLAGQTPTEELLKEVGAIVQRSVDPETDMHASGEYRAEMAGVLTRRGLKQALSDAGMTLA